MSTVGAASLFRNGVVGVGVVVDVDAKLLRSDVTVAPDEESTEAGLGDEVKDGVEDGLGVGRDDVATLAETPGNGVEDP